MFSRRCLLPKVNDALLYRRDFVYVDVAVAADMIELFTGEQGCDFSAVILFLIL